MNDVSPEILAKVQAQFHRDRDNSSIIKEIVDKIDSGNATYKDAERYSEELGRILGDAYRSITAEDLPNGRMYKNIYDKVVSPTLQDNYEDVSEQTTKVQDSLNRNAGIHLKTQVPDINTDRIEELGFKIADYEDFDEAAGLLASAAGNFTQSIVDDFIKENADFHYKSGMQPKIVRTAAAGCCKWCSELGGTYLYSEIGKNSDVFRRHQNCNCVVEYNPGDGKIQNVHNKAWRREAAERNQNSEFEQEYKPVVRGEKRLNSKYGGVVLRRAEGYKNDIYISENVSLKPRALYTLDNDLSRAIKTYHGNMQNRPKIAVLSQKEIGEGRVAVYDPVGNTIYTIPEVGDHRKILEFQKDMTYGSNPRATMHHETWHWMQAEEFRNKNGNVTEENKGEYIKYAVEQGKKRLDKEGISEYNVTRISDYAARKYVSGRYDEVDAELQVYRKLKGK